MTRTPMCSVRWCIAMAVKDGLCAIHRERPKYAPPPVSTQAVAAVWDRVPVASVPPAKTDDEVPDK